MLLFIIIISIIFVVLEYCSKSWYDIIPFINEIGFKETKTTFDISLELESSCFLLYFFFWNVVVVYVPTAKVGLVKNMYKQV